MADNLFNGDLILNKSRTYAMCNNSIHANTAICAKSTIIDNYNYMPSEESHNNAMVALIVPIIFGLIVFVGFIGNALVVIVVMANQQMRNTTNLLIINLAVADLLFIVFCVPFTASDYALPFWPFGNAWCKVVQYLVVVTAYASVYTLVLMSLDRFLAVVHPIRSMSIRTEANTYRAILFIWLVILFSCAPLITTHGVHFYRVGDEEFNSCIFLDREGYSRPTFQIVFFATSYVLPLLLICGLYVCMLLRLWRGVAPGGRVSNESRRGKKRVTRMIVIVIIIFAVCWCPIQVILVMKSLDIYAPMTSTLITLQIASHVLAYLNSCVNPILYAFLSDNFRKAFRKVIYCRAFANQERPGLPNNNAEKSYLRQPLCTQTNLTQLKGVNNGGAAPAEQEAEDAV